MQDVAGVREIDCRRDLFGHMDNGRYCRFGCRRGDQGDRGGAVDVLHGDPQRRRNTVCGDAESLCSAVRLCVGLDLPARVHLDDVRVVESGCDGELTLETFGSAGIAGFIGMQHLERLRGALVATVNAVNISTTAATHQRIDGVAGHVGSRQVHLVRVSVR